MGWLIFIQPFWLSECVFDLLAASAFFLIAFVVMA